MIGNALKKSVRPLFHLGLLVLVASGLSCAALNFVKRRLPPPQQSEKGVLFRFYSPSARVVQLAGSWPENNWLSGQAQTGSFRIGLMADDGRRRHLGALREAATRPLPVQVPDRRRELEGRSQQPAAHRRRVRRVQFAADREIARAPPRPGGLRGSRSRRVRRPGGGGLRIVMRTLMRRLAGLALLAAVAAGGCDRAPSRPDLFPTGEFLTPAVNVISGQVSFNTAPPGTPYVRVYALREDDSTCVSEYTAIQAAGNHTNPAFSLANTPVMQRLLGCVWVDSLNLNPAALGTPPGRLNWKFVTGRNFDSPPDYGSIGRDPEVPTDGFEGRVRHGAAGSEGNLAADIPATGPYLLILNEQLLRYWLLAWDEAPIGVVDPATGAFEVDDLRDGRYTLVFQGDGIATRIFRQASVAGGDTARVGTIALEAEAPGCESTYDKIQVAGNLNEGLYGNFDLTRAPEMTAVGGCAWEATLEGITAGDHYFKFVTDGAFDNPPDYGGAEVCTSELSGPVTVASGVGTALCVTFPEDGDYVFRLDEQALTYTITKSGGTAVQRGRLKGRIHFADNPTALPEARVELFKAGTTQRVDQLDATESFSFSGVPIGVYDVKFSATGYQATTVTDTVFANQTTDIGTVDLQLGFTSQFVKIEVIGDFPTVNWDPGAAPDMVQDPAGIWKAVVNGVTAGNHYFKFRTNDNWETPDADYGTPTDETCRPELTGGVALVTSGSGTALCVIFPEAGNYRFTLDETALTYAIEKVIVAQPATIRGAVAFNGAPPAGGKAFVQLFQGTTIVDSDSTAGAFEFTDLVAGTYDVRASAQGYLAQTQAVTGVAAGQTRDVGTITLQPGFSSRFNTIAVIGDFPGINWDPASAAVMTQVSPGVWKATLQGVTGGNHLMKYRTNNNWESPDPDYGSNFDQTCRPNLTGPVTMIGTGGDNALCITFPTGTAAYEFTLNEIDLTYEIVRQGQAGQGSIAGTVDFGGISQAPYPTAIVRLRTQGGSSDLGSVTTDPTTRAFSFTQLDPGTYQVIVSANCFGVVTVENLEVNNDAVSAGAVSLSLTGSAFQRIQVAGSFNGFDLGAATDMTALANCVWADTVTVLDVANPVEFKFITNGDFDTTPDYGLPGDQVDPASGACVLGAGGSGGNIRVTLAEPGRYRFELDEIYSRYSVTYVGSVGAPARGRRF